MTERDISQVEGRQSNKRNSLKAVIEDSDQAQFFGLIDTRKTTRALKHFRHTSKLLLTKSRTQKSSDPTDSSGEERDSGPYALRSNSKLDN